ncbi:MAG: ribosome biogenesis GTP-binding protein YihA/YsxC [Candidatus Cloacimonadales bacterium]
MRVVESNFNKSATKPDQYPPTPFTDLAFVGKSNVGKSSMINVLLQRKAIAKVSGKPGKTRLLNFFDVRMKNAEEQDVFFTAVDLPGYGFAKVSKSEREAWRKMIMLYFEQRLQLNGVVVLVDIRHKADPKDKLMLDMLKGANIPFLLVATKSDKLPKSKIAAELKKRRVEFEVPAQQAIAFSALKKTGLDDLMAWVESRLQ